ncbi:MAG: hypothetical protein QG608_2073 [Actinomycetota bacterium]|nr:hypothetical protein [Actinomycetota bacterium]
MKKLGRMPVQLQGKAVMACLVSGALVATGAVTFLVRDSSAPSGDRAAPTGPRNSSVRSVQLPAPQAGSTTVHARDEATEPFSLIGVTWDDAAQLVEGRVQVRARSTDTGKWTAWADLGSEQGEEGTADARRGGTEPVWVGNSDGVEVRVDGRTVEGLPAGMRLDLVDPDREPTDNTLAQGTAPRWQLASQRMDDPAPAGQTPTPTEEATPPVDTPQEPGTPANTPAPSQTPTPTAEQTTAPVEPKAPPAQDPTPTATATPKPSASASVSVAPTPTKTKPPTAIQNTPVTRPAITLRAGWQANEKLREQTEPDYTATSPKVVFVHHTATTTDYVCTDSAKIVRSLYSYHVTSLGWRDLGYNFVVDRCGTIFEGRYGGIDQGVIGAHTYGFNTGSTGISVIGTYSDSPAPLPARQAVAHLAAWKLGLAGQSSTQTAQLTQATADSPGYTKGKTYTFNSISGHRDGYATECPGEAFYQKLPEIRSWAAAPTNLKVTAVTGANSADNAYYTKGAVKLTWSVSTPTRLLRSFELLVDGAVKTTLAGTATTASVTVPAGKHTVALRATHLTGLTATSTLTVNGDVTAPKFATWPAAAVRTGQVSTAAVPVTVSWKASDNLALASVKATAPTAASFAPTTTAWSTSLKPGGARKITLQAVDRAGNTSAAATITRTPLLTSEQKGTKAGTWAQQAGSSYLGGAILAASRKGASLTWTVTGRSVGLVAFKSARSGTATVYVDGAKAGTVNLYSASNQYRQIVWTKTVASGKHTIKMVVDGTSGRPNVHADGLAVLQ